MGRLSNYLYQMNPIIGEIFLMIDSLLILLFVYFILGYVLWKSLKPFRWALCLGVFSSLITLMFLRVDIYEESNLLLTRKYLLYVMPMFATILGWYVLSRRKHLR
ncbi:MAG: hypothetical protein DHS20C01_26260 [marine bacterium B5-7]|nr:MAG: hypothetical protein DHS20C01_26260 [marine bacterium B5-7]